MENNTENSVKAENSIKKKPKKRKNKIISIVLAITLVCAAIIGYFYSEVKKWDNLMMPNVSIEGVDYTGQTKEEVLTQLNKIYGDSTLAKKVEIQALDKRYSIGYEELDVKYNIDETVEKAFAYARNLSFLDKHKLISNPENQEFDLQFTYNNKPIQDIIKIMEGEINREVQEASIKYIGSGKFEVTDDVKGAKLDTQKLANDINNKIQSEAEDLTVVAPIEETVAEITGEQLRTIDSKVGTYSTSYTTSSWTRSTNIEIATKAIDGTLLMPGEVFSFNDTVGERTVARGYQIAHVILNGEYVDGIGGGICQVSTTLYNSVLLAGLEIVERSHHTYPSSYVPIGRDATVDYGNLDIKFKNNQEYPVYISAYSSKKHLYFTLYSSNVLNETQKSVTNNVYKTYPAIIETIEDPTLPLGEEVIDKPAHTGYKVNVYRTIYKDGVKIDTETVSSDYFLPSNGEKRVGTMVEEIIPEVETTPEVENVTGATETTTIE